MASLDLPDILVRDHHAEVAHVLRRLAQRGGVDPGEDKRGAVAEEQRGHGRALGLRHVPSERLLNGRDARVEGQRL
jgi:hypothetical protein